MKHLLKHGAALMALFLAAASLAACGSGGSTSSGSVPAEEGSSQTEAASQDDSAAAPSGDRTNLSLYTWTDDGAYMSGIVDAYNAREDSLAQVELTIIPSDEYEDKIVTMMAGGTDIDMMNNRSMTYVSRLASTGNLYDLTDLINSQVDVAPYGTSYAETQIDGKFYALPYRQLSYVLFYNKKAFDAAGEPYPTDLTWDEYADLALKLTSGEGNDRIYGGYIPEWLGITYIPQQKGSNYADDDVSALRESLEFQNRIFNTDNSHMSFIEMKSTGTDYLQFFCSGRAAMLPNGDWCLGDIQRVLADNPGLDEGFELGVAFLPQVEKGQQITCGGVSTFISINAKSKNPEVAFDYVKYLGGPDAAILVAEAGQLPAYASDEVIDTYKKNAEGIDGVDNLLIGDKVPEGLFFPEYSELSDIFLEEKEMYLIGSQSLDETMENFVSRRERVMNG